MIEILKKDPHLLFILGLSGVGKSQLGVWIEEDLNFLHIEQDSPDGNGIEIWGLRSVWDEYLYARNPKPLAKLLQVLALKANRHGTVITFSSMIRPSISDINLARSVGIRTVILFGSDAECLSSYLEREKQINRGFNEERWREYNTDSFKRFSLPDYEPYHLSAFENGKHRSRKHLVEEIIDKLNT